MDFTLTPSREDFAVSDRPQLVVTRFINDIDTPLSAFMKAGLGKPYSFFFESVQSGDQVGRFSFFGFDPDIIWRATGYAVELSRDGRTFEPIDGKPLETLRALIAETSFDLPDGYPPMAAGLFGYLGYDTVRQVEALGPPNPDPIGTPDGIKVRPRTICIFDQVKQEIIIAALVPPGGEFGEAEQRIRSVIADLDGEAPSLPSSTVSVPSIVPQLGTDLPAFAKRVDKARDYILAGDVFQVVIGQRLSAPLPAPPIALYRALRRMNPSPFLYFLDFDDHQIVGSSPEILVRLQGGTVTIRPIAGTRPRGKTSSEDLENERSLLADPKERAEHLMLLDLGRNDVGRVAVGGTVRPTEQFIVERYSHVMHIVSNVEGAIRDGLDCIDALMAGFPAGTVSGAPKVRAMEIIDELEDEKRGIYAGSVGYISANGDMDTAIALRTGIVKDGVLHVRAGAGIVLDSTAEYEWAETKHKAAALFRAAEQSVRFNRN